MELQVSGSEWSAVLCSVVERERGAAALVCGAGKRRRRCASCADGGPGSGWSTVWSAGNKRRAAAPERSEVGRHSRQRAHADEGSMSGAGNGSAPAGDSAREERPRWFVRGKATAAMRVHVVGMLTGDPLPAGPGHRGGISVFSETCVASSVALNHPLQLAPAPPLRAARWVQTSTMGRDNRRVPTCLHQ